MSKRIIKTFDEYVEHTEAMKGGFYFRGHADMTWDIKPSLLRDDVNITLEEEFGAVRAEMSKTAKSSLAAILKLQHYGTKTRMLDITISPMAALFFACSGESEKDGEVLVIKRDNDLRHDALQTFDKIYNSEKCTDEELEIATKNHTIRYDIGFSYTNPRAMLQGGTAILFGFGLTSGVLCQKNSDLNGDLVFDRIIIPAVSKKAMLHELREIGYTSDVLYENGIVVAEKLSVILHRYTIKTIMGNCKKYIAFFKINTLYFVQSELETKIQSIYEQLYITYGKNVRAWLFFYYDDNDAVIDENCIVVAGQSNWICRTTWNKGDTYDIKWNDEYLKKRLTRINEEYADSAVLEDYKKLFDEILIYYENIKNSRNDDYLSVIKSHSAQINKITVWQAQDVPFCSQKGELMVKKYLDFICEVGRFNDVLISLERGDKEVYLKWLYNQIIDDCEYKLSLVLESR